MKKYINIIFSLALLSVGTTQVSAQVLDSSFSYKEIDYTTFVRLVGKNNLAYSAEKFNVDIAEAEILQARVFPDPELSFEASDNGQRRMKMGYGFASELSWTVELGGKRHARLDVAKDQVQMTRLLLEDYFRNLRADATLAYLTALQNKMLLDVQQTSYEQMKKLAEADSIRYRLGSISQVDARQSKLEASTMLNEVFAAEAEWKSALADLSTLLGDEQIDFLWNPTGDLKGLGRDFVLSEIIGEAKMNRADLQAALQQKNLSASLLKLAKANRAIDLGLSLGMDYASYVNNVIAPTPSMTTVKVGVSVPLKFSNKHPAEVRSAQWGMLQAEKEHKQTALVIQSEVTQAYHGYQAAQKQVAQFEAGLLTDAQAILDGKIYSYQRGESSLLELLDAQRTYIEVQQNYYVTQYNCAAALVELERAVGIWDINF